MKKLIVILIFALLGISWVTAFNYIKHSDGIIILLYHKIDSKSHPLHQDLTVTPSAFEKQIQFFKKRGYHFLSAKELVQYYEKKDYDVRKGVMITFDDGTVDNYTQAWPVLKRADAQATIFLISDFIGQKRDWADEMTTFLTAEQITEMEKGGIDFGSHSATHPSLPGLNREEIKREAEISKTALEKILGQPVYFFSYPHGSYNREIIEVLRPQYKLACSLHGGINRKNTNPYALRRIKPNNSYIDFVFQIYISPFIEWIRSFQ